MRGVVTWKLSNWPRMPGPLSLGMIWEFQWGQGLRRRPLAPRHIGTALSAPMQITPSPSCRGMSFHGTTIGLAPLMAMCSVYQSGGVNMVSLSQYTDAAEGGKMPHKTGSYLVKNNFIFITAGKKSLIPRRAIV